MKKWIIAAAVCIVVLTSLLFILIPGTITVNKSTVMGNNLKGLKRILSADKNWHKWWPVTTDEKGLVFNNNFYSVTDIAFSSIFITVKHNNLDTKSSLTFIPVTTDSTKLDWEIQIPTSFNPIQRLRTYLFARSLQKDIPVLLSNIKQYYTSNASVYDLDIRREIVDDSTMISTFDSTSGYPSTEKIYSLIDKLRAYIGSQQALATDSPMLNIYSRDNKTFFIRVAFPTNKTLPSKGDIAFRKMLYGGNILTALVKGAPNKADSAIGIMENYLSDFEIESPAIPFYSLVTNRLAERDSTKWITKIYYPVMYYK